MKTKRKKKKAKGIAIPKVKRKRVNGNRIMIHEPMRIIKKNKPEREFTPDKSVRFEINGVSYRVKINEQNKCLEIDTTLTDCHCYIQPVSTSNFLIKAQKYKGE